jgi:hypothetical protein
MRHSGRTLKTYSLSNTLEVFTVAAKAIVYRMAQLMHQGIQQLDWVI